MIGGGTALLETEQGSLITIIGFPLIIYHSPLPHTYAFIPAPAPQSRSVLSPLPRLFFLIRIHTGGCCDPVHLTYTGSHIREHCEKMRTLDAFITSQPLSPTCIR